MKCSIDNTAPRQGSHLRTKAKKNALLEDRIDQIHTENRILLEKMSHIMRSKGGIDNKNNSIKYGQSLNRDRRKRELQRITVDNYDILRRIQDVRPTYDHSKWEKEAKDQRRLLKNICDFRRDRQCIFSPSEESQIPLFRQEPDLLNYGADDMSWNRDLFNEYS